MKKYPTFAWSNKAENTLNECAFKYILSIYKAYRGKYTRIGTFEHLINRVDEAMKVTDIQRIIEGALIKQKITDEKEVEYFAKTIYRAVYKVDLNEYYNGKSNVPPFKSVVGNRQLPDKKEVISAVETIVKNTPIRNKVIQGSLINYLDNQPIKINEHEVHLLKKESYRENDKIYIYEHTDFSYETAYYLYKKGNQLENMFFLLEDGSVECVKNHEEQIREFENQIRETLIKMKGYVQAGTRNKPIDDRGVEANWSHCNNCEFIHYCPKKTVDF